MAPPKSKMWIYFTKKNSTESQCKLCLKIIKYSGNTTNLSKHMKFKHPVYFKKSTEEESKKRSTSIEGTTVIADPCPSTSTSSTALSQQEDKTKAIKEETEHFNFGGIKRSFQNMTSIAEGGQKYAAITNAILYLICKDNRPFHMVSGEGFQVLLKEVAPGYKIPSEKLFKKLLDDKYEAIQEMYVNKFKNIDFFSVTCDVWSETMTMRSFLGITVHYVDDISFKSTALEVEELTERHTGLYLGKRLSGILSKWKILVEKVVAVVTDNGANIVSAIHQTESLGKAKHIPCFAHTLNLVAEVLIANPSIAPLIVKVREIVKWVKASVVISDQIRNIQKENGIAEGNLKKFILDVKTRWNSVFYMLERYLELQDLVNPILLKTPKSPNVLSASEANTIKEFISLLKPLEFMTRELSGEKYITISKIIPMLYCCYLQLDVTVANSEDTVIKTCKTSLLNEMNKRFGHIEMCLPIAFATLLDPRFKNLNFRNAMACGTAISKLKKLIETPIVSESNSNTEESVENQDAHKEDYSDQFWKHHTEIAHGKKRLKTGHATLIDDELGLYLKNPVASLNSNPFELWKDMKAVFPNLFNISKKYLSVTATSVPSERLFSKAGATVCRDRNRLLGKRLNKIVFLGSCSKTDWAV